MSKEAKLADIQVTSAKGAVVVSSDAGWLCQSAFVLQQAIDSDPQGLLDYYYFCNFDVAGSDFPSILNDRVQVIRVQDDALGVQYRQTSHVPIGTFLRFAALEILSRHYPRVCYLDGDLFLSWGSWTELFDLPFGQHAIAGVAARSVWYDDARFRYGRRYRQALLQGDCDRYLNAGVLLINSELYANLQISKKSVDFVNSHPDLCRFGDQSALNAILSGRWDELSPSWNWQVSLHNYPLLIDKNPRVIHFCGEVKPWNDSYNLFRRATMAYAEFLNRHSVQPAAAALAEQLAADPYAHAARLQRIIDWTSQTVEKQAMFQNYMIRRDFFDTIAGLAIFSEEDSGFGRPPAGMPAAPQSC